MLCEFHFNKKSVYVNIAIKHRRHLLGLFKEFKISGFVNCGNRTKQISISLEIEIKFDDYYI